MSSNHNGRTLLSVMGALALIYGAITTHTFADSAEAAASKDEASSPQWVSVELLDGEHADHGVLRGQIEAVADAEGLSDVQMAELAERTCDLLHAMSFDDPSRHIELMTQWGGEFSDQTYRTPGGIQIDPLAMWPDSEGDRAFDAVNVDSVAIVSEMNIEPSPIVIASADRSKRLNIASPICFQRSPFPSDAERDALSRIQVYFDARLNDGTVVTLGYVFRWEPSVNSWSPNLRFIVSDRDQIFGGYMF